MKQEDEKTSNGTEPTIDPMVVWDDRYTHTRKEAVSSPHDPWLERWAGLFNGIGTSAVIELGCGFGRDTHWLANRGVKVIGVDFSREALCLARSGGGGASFLVADLRSKLPIRPGACRLIIAGLVLHYFTWVDTLRIIQDIAVSLVAGGLLLARLNSVEDVNFGARGNLEVEPGLFLVDGVLKRFFDRDGIKALFGEGWHLLELEHRSAVRSGKIKWLWEVLATTTNTA